MFLRIVRAHCAEQSGIKEVKIPFDLYLVYQDQLFGGRLWQVFYMEQA